MFTTTPSSVCQNPKSCFDTLSFEPRDLMHQLTPSKQRPEIDNSETEQIYVHPLIKPPSLSSKSLEMCTESLGSETGCNTISDLDFFSYHAFEKPSPCRVNPAKNKEKSKKIKKRHDFPPPLTSFGGNEGVRVQVQARREAGRLVIKAFNFARRSNYFHAERENGRLTLSLVRDSENNDELLENKEEEERAKEKKGNGNEKDLCEDDDDHDGRRYHHREEDMSTDDGGRIGCKINEGDWAGRSRCNGDSSSRSKSRQLSLAFYVAIS